MENIFAKEIINCLNCNESLIGVHGSRKFCPNEILLDGSIKSCKDDYHNKGKKIVRDATKALVRIHYSNFLILQRLYEQGKIVMTMDELKKEGFLVNYPVSRAKLEGSNEFVQFYLGYMLKQDSPMKLQIIKHECKF